MRGCYGAVGDVTNITAIVIYYSPPGATQSWVKTEYSNIISFCHFSQHELIRKLFQNFVTNLKVCSRRLNVVIVIQGVEQL